MLTTRPTQIVVVDDHPVVRYGVAAQLNGYPDLRVVGHAETGADAVQLCAGEQPDIVLLDLRLPDCPAADVVAEVHRVSPGSRVLLFTVFPEHAAVAPALAAGACGLLVKDASGTAVRDAIRSVARTGTFRAGRSAPSAAPVTAREYDVLRLVAAGYTNPAIGDELNLSVNTVKTYLREMMHKLAARNRAQLISYARTRGLL
ncbi:MULTISPECIES: response regulator transcription factor [unclassified Streptomyces]|uniref:response regulator transcription factor n=1 Tax=unclassified Streptomyces TaxID=2593676 RepID=UPI002E794730|nr:MULTISPECIES: response regulator transcription factor [unclassified Streptomyces]MEE1760372.1 response regulator transcription factor [Streptomyces sp. SP18BB07]MEE1836465.1 response regulator transcription factor [Streptomyces sp. SP17KL33]